MTVDSSPPLRIGVIRSELARNFADLDSKPRSSFPGSTTGLTGSLGSFSKFLLRAFMYPTPQGALTQLWAGTSPDTANLNGAVRISFFYLRPTRLIPCAVVSRSMGASYQASQ